MPESKEKNLAEQIAEKIDKAGGKTFFVGGCVRDMILGVESKDIDIEVHGIEKSTLKEILTGFGEIGERKVGEHFGILNIKGYNLDISMPRSEAPSVPNGGHKDFTVDVDPFIGEEAACRRRDFTINAIMQDVVTGEIIDFFGGTDDLEKGILRCVDESSFADDPLRVLRAAQFASRFQFNVDESTVELCSKIDLSRLTHERVAGELSKALMRSEKPSVFFNVLRSMNQLDFWFKEVSDLIGVQQNAVHHQEGDVYNHTMLVLDEAAKNREDAMDPLYFMVAAMCHDFGKPAATVYDEQKGKWTAIGHDKLGVEPAQNFVTRIYNSKDMSEYVANMVELHMRPLLLMKSKARAKSYMHLFDEALFPEDLILLTMCDNDGKKSCKNEEYDEHILKTMFWRYEWLMSQPHVVGKDLIGLGYVPGPQFGEILGFARKLRLAGIDKEDTLRHIAGTFQPMRKNSK